jgi:xanthine dehydrogenase YagR molybdenum-binding subunit
MDLDRKEKLVLGFGDQRREIEVQVPDEDPRPWDLDSRFSVVGKALPRADGRAKVTGRARYTADVTLPGLLFGGFVRCPVAKAAIHRVDLDAVRGHPAVKAVLDLGVRETRYADQPLAAVAAETRQGLEEAIRMARLDYEALPHAARMEQAMAEGAPAVHRNRPNVGERRPARNAEDVERALAAAELQVQLTCETAVQVHCSLEPHGIVAHWEGDRLTVWASTQATFGVRSDLADALGIPHANVKVITEYMGGGFGSKFAAGYFGLAAARLAREAGRPVKLMLGRREELTDTGNRPNSIQTMRLGLTRAGKIGPYAVDIVGTPGVGRNAGARNPMIYDFDTALVARTETEVATNAGPQAAFRAPGHPQGSFALESILDLAAEAAGLDPIEFRLRNDSHPVRRAQYRDGAIRIGWSERKPTGSAKGRFRRGLGVAAAVWYQIGAPGGAEVLCRILRDGSVEMRNGCQDIGTGTRTILQVIGAEELGLPPERVVPFLGVTDDPVGPGSGGSVTAPTIAPAARQAAWQAGRRLCELVARELGGEAGDYLLLGGRVVHGKDGTKALPFAEACRLIDEEIAVTGKRSRNFATYQGTVGGVQFADVVVDCDYGVVTVRKIVALQDAGIIINRNQAESQVHGGVIQGLSYALFEERVMDRHLGQMLNGDLETYKIAGPKDIPEIECVLYDVSNGGNTTSTAGIGEPTMVPTAAAIAGAVHNAIGVRVPALPMTPDRVLQALAGAEQGR